MDGTHEMPCYQRSSTCQISVYIRTQTSFQGDTSVVVLFVLCLGVLFFVMLAPYICYHILVKLRYLSGHLLGNSCSFGLLNVVMVLVPYC